MANSYFSGCITIDDVKSRYRELAMKLHPDKNGGTAESTREFQEMNAAYTFAMSQAIKGERPGDSPESQQAESELMERIRKAVEVACSLPNVDVTIRGLWIWCEGDTKPVKDVLKDAGYSWLNKRKCWVFKGVRSFNRGKAWTIGEIEERYGAQKMKSQFSGAMAKR